MFGTLTIILQKKYPRLTIKYWNSSIPLIDVYDNCSNLFISIYDNKIFDANTRKIYYITPNHPEHFQTIDEMIKRFYDDERDRAIVSTITTKVSSIETI